MDWQRNGIGLILAGIVLTGCVTQAAAQADDAPANTPRPPSIPSGVPLTATPSLTPTVTLTLTITLTPTPRPTKTPEATATPSLTAYPTAVPLDYTVSVSGLDFGMRQVYLKGIAQGRDLHRFSKIGDCQVTSVSFLQAIDRGYYTLGEYAHLQGAIDHFAGSFSRVGPTGVDGMKMDTMLNPMWADPRICAEGENRVACEFRVYNPSVVFIYIQPRVRGDAWAVEYRDSLVRAVQMALDLGIIPIMSTHILWDGHETVTQETNDIVEQVALEMGVPFWDFNASTRHLPAGGDHGNWHMSISPYGSLDFSDPRNFEYAMTLRNLETLLILDMLLRDVMY